VEIGSKTFQEFVEDQKDHFSIVIRGAGEPISWLNGIAADLKEAEIVTVDQCFSRAYTLSDNALGKKGRTDLVLVFDLESKPNMGKMALWRIGYGGTVCWTEDFITNNGKDYGVVQQSDDDEDDTEDD
jgi:hypothetical protein